MLKGAWILPAVMVVVLVLAALVPAAASAADNGPFARSPDSFFKNLPGVQPQQSLTDSDPNSYKCTSHIGTVYGFRGHGGFPFWDNAPARIYNCETKNGIRYTGTQMPNNQWVPGLNPHNLPE
ncbi:hypothetical protein [Neorhizobium alkalisoli]|jgi:hypothetical protein|uniref:Uncharacterized protein n=1 Tax=Neorhizobium alkalisoli TaxID=528178 RepID=A0A561QRH1_9HYPH|nr:hypothetical protein [Neorhizobium alkalisoli]TWF52949.1 hypothetical protein FHW37_104218 [Neorhizobium alkalisoli]